MLRVTIPSRELYDETKGEFIYTKAIELQLEHSLVSLSKWESKWCTPFISTKNKTTAQSIDYIRAMTLTQNVDSSVYLSIPNEVMNQVAAYIDAPMTATILPKTTQKKTNSEIITSELIYYWMIAFNIPFECQKWHLNRLLTLINVCNIKNQPKKKRTPKEIMAERRAINEANKARFGTKG